MLDPVASLSHVGRKVRKLVTPRKGRSGLRQEGVLMMMHELGGHSSQLLTNVVPLGS